MPTGAGNGTLVSNTMKSDPTLPVPDKLVQLSPKKADDGFVEAGQKTVR
ncbi:hypothetical protein [Nocardia sp. R6R-6]